MLYNNPIAYGTDVSPDELAALADRHANLEAVKESSGDVRRVTAIRATLGDRLAVFMGVDDLVVEGVQAGALGWIAGLVNALPRESVRLFELALAGRAAALYAWFLPLLRLDVVPKFVQLIKLTQQECGVGSERVRPPRPAARRRGARRGAGADPELAREPPETLRAASRPPSIEAIPAARYCATWIAGMLSRIESRISVVR
jgi:4-hydroxy-tetrahydrodipicolinate synthase